MDVRLNNVSQLAGFAKRDDLRYFLGVICGADYVHEPLLAPTQEMLDGYRKSGGSWADYEKALTRGRPFGFRMPSEAEPRPSGSAAVAPSSLRSGPKTLEKDERAQRRRSAQNARGSSRATSRALGSWNAWSSRRVRPPARSRREGAAFRKARGGWRRRPPRAARPRRRTPAACG